MSRSAIDEGLRPYRRELAEKLRHDPTDDQLYSHLMYPQVFAEFQKQQREYGEVSVLPTPAFFYGLSTGEEITVDIEEGKTLIIRLVSVGAPDADGRRALSFELNGMAREAYITDKGVAAAAAPGTCIVLCPTIAPESVESFAARLETLGLDWIDAPMSGGPARARAGTMSLMVACRDAVLERHASLLASLADPVFRLGDRAGDGARTKLVNNLLAAINLVGAAEALALAERVGLDAARTLAVIERSSGQSWIGGDRMARALAGATAPLAHTTLLAKDSGLAVAMAAAAGVEPRLGALAAATFASAVAQGHGERDDSCLLELLRGRPL